jgi:hypothetical protein
MKEYIIKHDDTDVALVEINDSFRMSTIREVLCNDHLPAYIKCSKDKSMYAYDEWFRNRIISSSREGIRKVLKKYNADNTRALALMNYGLSLFDHYWICAKDSNKTWSEINFFDNKFKADVGDILIGDFSNRTIEGLTPESTSGGALPKKWEWRNGETFLIKKGGGSYRQEPFNEVIASNVCKRLGIPHVEYTLGWRKNDPRCSCKNMLKKGEELIHAWDIAHDMDQKNDKYGQYIEFCNKAGISDTKSDLNKMLVVDYIIGNVDRHFNNFGYIRDSKTLEYKGFAPIYDCGDAFWHNEDIASIKNDGNTTSKPFKGKHTDQIKKVSDFSWFSIENLHGFYDDMRAILTLNKRLPEDRIELLIHTTAKRVNDIHERRVLKNNTKKNTVSRK